MQLLSVTIRPESPAVTPGGRAPGLGPAAAIRVYLVTRVGPEKH